MNTQYFLDKLIHKESLTSEESGNLLEKIMKGTVTPVQTASILIALRMKGETSEEIVGFVKMMRKHMVCVSSIGVVIDTCGTGGDGKGTINISTVTALAVAGAGVKVAKHGNRATSSQCGSADVLEELGVNIILNAKEAERILEEIGIVFLYAPLFHPATKNVVSVRKELKVLTVFNYLGPFVNPCGIKRQLVGVPDRGIAKILAQASTQLDYEHLLIVTSEDGTDEITLSGKTFVIEVKGNHMHEFVIDPSRFGFNHYQRYEIVGGNSQDNAKAIRSILTGEKGILRDTILINAAAALYVSGRVKKIEDGIPLAQKALDSGRAAIVLEKLIKATNDN